MAKTVSPEQAEFEAELNLAAKALKEAKTAQDIRNVWDAHFGKLGHRALGRLLRGATAESIIAKKFKE